MKYMLTMLYKMKGKIVLEKAVGKSYISTEEMNSIILGVDGE